MKNIDYSDLKMFYIDQSPINIKILMNDIQSDYFKKYPNPKQSERNHWRNIRHKLYNGLESVLISDIVKLYNYYNY